MKLAIKGHPTRGKEVIELLEMLGGKNIHNYGGTFNECYAIDNDNICTIYTRVAEIDNLIIFTLEEFEKKFPYKVGDKVLAYCEGIFAQFTIQDMRWNYELNEIEYKICQSWCDTSLIQPYKEETMEESANKAIFEGNAQSCDVMNDIIKKDIEQIKLDISEGYEFFGIDDNNKVVLTKIQPKYPKTFEECCEVLDCKADHFFTDFSYKGCDIEISDYEYKIDDLLQNFRKLRYCRDAYWEIAGDEMGLNGHWEPDECEGYFYPKC